MAMDDSVLTSIKKMLGIFEDDTSFDQDIMVHINSTFATLHQIGAAPIAGFYIEDKTAKWSDFFLDVNNVQMVKTYMYQKVRLAFDPPTTSFGITALEKQILENEWRLNIMEVKFNPLALLGLDPNGNLWVIDDAGDFPPEAPIGAYGIDPDTGNVWRNT